jgi:hypothetical protein
VAMRRKHAPARILFPLLALEFPPAKLEELCHV